MEVLQNKNFQPERLEKRVERPDTVSVGLHGQSKKENHLLHP